MTPAVLLLIPGMFNTAAIWRPVLEALHGQAGAPEVRIADVLSQDSITAMADDAWRLVSDLPAGTALVVCGFSMGGYVALELLAEHPGRVQALALVDSSAAVETPESTVVREKTISALERNFARTVEGMRAMMHAVGAQAAIRQNRAIIGRRDHRALLRQLDLPTLIVCGREDKVTPPPASEELKTLLPHARLEWIAHAGHQTVLEQAPTVARHLLSLVRAASSPTLP
jgi:pimeloyl-ACP methyl ester carboxylesterase